MKNNKRINRELSPRELQVYLIVITGLKNKVIARKLKITEKTVKHHLTNIFAKEDVDCRSALIAKHFKKVIGL